MNRHPRPHLHTVEEIVDMMRGRMRDLVQAWGLQGRYDGNDFVCLNPLRADRKAGSFRVCVRGSHQGLVRDFAGGQNWSPLSFTADLMFGGDNAQALRWARAFLGLDGADPDSFQRTQAAVRQREAAPPPDEEAEAKRRAAHAIWLEARADVAGTPVERYLRGRAIDLRRLMFPVRSLRFHPGLRNAESGRDWPAMVAAIVGADGQFLSVHRTWLEVRPDGTVRKAPLEHPKKTLGRYAGGTIRLWRGHTTDKQTGEVRQGRKLSDPKLDGWCDITEGLEDGLSVALACPDARVLVGVALASMAAIRLPPGIEGVNLWQQNDPPGSPAEKAFGRVVENFHQQGKRVRLCRPPAGFKDANEALQAAIAAEQGRAEA